jgi:replicative DNA helicase
MRTKCRRLHSELGLDLIVVDYLQLMSSGAKNDNRVQEISYISRGLKELARELNVPLMSAAQLSRSVEQRSDKRPQLSDLRESGCLAGDTLVYLPESNSYAPIASLEGKSAFTVLSLDPATNQLKPALVSHAFSTGRQPIFRLITALGRSIRATGNHKFLTRDGWLRLDELSIGERIAVPAFVEVAAESTLVLEIAANGIGFSHAHARSTANESHDAINWDAIMSITPDGESEVYDLTVPQYSNFVADGIVVHNSIEQDADIVTFLYRDELYNPNTEFPNQAEVLISKHRNGPTGKITLFFKKELTQFLNMSKSTIDLGAL